MQQLSSMDAVMIHVETPRGLNVLNSALLYDPSTAPGGIVTFEAIQRHLESRLHLARAFRQRLVRTPFDLDEPYWLEDPNFDLDFHLRHMALPAPGNWQQLIDQVARLVANPLDMTRPLWELYMIEGLNEVEAVPRGSFCLLLRNHHAAIDGVSGAVMLDAISDHSPTVEPMAADTSWRPEPIPSSWSLLQRAAVHSALRPVRIGRQLLSAIPAVRADRANPSSGGNGDVRMPGMTVPATRFNRPVTPHRVLDARWFPLEEVKRMRSAANAATVNDVALTVVAGAMRRYLGSKDELPDASLVAMVPMSTRTEAEASSGGNHVSMFRVPLHTDIADPVERLTATSKVTSVLKERNRGVGARKLAEISEQLPGRLIGMSQRTLTGFAARRGMGIGANTTVTNVPGSQHPLYFAGARMVRSFGAAPVLDGAGLIHVVGSYCGEMHFLFTACREMMPDPQWYTACIQDSFDELSNATPRNRRAPTRQKVR